MKYLPINILPGFAERFEAKMTRTDSCWIWKAAVDRDGYGKFWNGEVTTRAHRFAYVLYTGPIPEGLTIDHLCRNPSCVNPAHLEAVTGGVNVLRGNNPPAINARKTHCVNGHAFDDANTYWYSNGYRCCRICNNQAGLRSRARRMESA